MMNETNPIRDLTLALADFACANSDDTLDDACNDLADAIANCESMPPAMHDAILAAATRIDPTMTFHAAHIRDALRDNFDFGDDIDLD